MNTEASIANQIRGIPGSVYVHIPFCLAKCCYCDFSSFPGCQTIFEPYSQAVCTEAGQFWGELEANRALPPKFLRTLYLGGGTPTLLSPAQIEHIMRAAAPEVWRADDAEITIEANPGTVNYDQFRQLRALGVNRLSLGVQSLDDNLLKWLGRVHTAEQAREAYRSARQAGFDNINLDFIFGLPSQTIDHWRQTLYQALELAPAHLSLYALTVEEGTPLCARVERGEVELPDEDLAADMYQLAEDMLAEAGYEHYELSNWARPGKQSRHNLTYWDNADYLGFGAGAHSHITSNVASHRLANLAEPRDYIAKIDLKQFPRASTETIDLPLDMAETVFLGLRRNSGISRQAFSARFGCTLEEQYGPALDDLRRLGLLVVDNQGIRLTRRGRLLGNEVFVRFLPSVAAH